ncbi:MAG: diguanylate cyclase [Aquincola sp.]|uniref:diguanylate cyclase n=1 Tax=uncultured Aquincola sp. TaxID=886556 RepID=UPI0032B1A2C7|nr:diguanylate cyclase [Aquincola sp.]|tara:strand:- start:2451 stop:5270 length:2820 start_codon:yes stop_codon:yes gene_type:complete
MDDLLMQCDAALARGRIDEARLLAEQLLRRLEHEEPTPEAAPALLRLAYCDVAQSRHPQAHARAAQVVRAAGRGGLPALEVEGLSLLTRTASVLGRVVESVESGLLATRLADGIPTGAWTVQAYTALGFALGCARAHDDAQQAFHSAARLAEQQLAAAAQLEVCVARAWVQAMRCFDEGRPAELSQVPSPLDALAAGSLALQDPLTPGAAATLRPSGLLVRGLLQVWSGRVDDARALLAQGSAPAPASLGWIQAAYSWLAAEVALADQSLEVAAMHAARMAALSAEVGYLPLQCMGHELAATIYQRQGNLALAVAERERQLRCERRVRAHNLQGRSEMADLRLQARHGDERIKLLADQSMKFERWAHEDALTGIANLRRFNQCLAEWSQAGEATGSPLCVALIDVDNFRDINNGFSYEVGNQALRGIAEEMSAHVRATDLAARWGGDEFAILFRDTDVETARQIALRLQDAVARHDWEAVAAGLRVGISVGVTEARVGDTKASLVARSEELMFAQKQARKRAEAEKAVAPLVLRTVTDWLRQARRVVLLAGQGSGPHGDFGDLALLQSDPQAFRRQWTDWRQQMRGRKPSAAQLALVELAHALPQAMLVSERVDGLLAMAGAENEVALYGNAFRRRCIGCGKTNPSTDVERCTTCGRAADDVRPDMVLPGEPVAEGLHAAAALAMKRADVILVLDSDGAIRSTRSMVDAATVRGARVVVLGQERHTWGAMADLTIAAQPEVVLAVLLQHLQQPPAAASPSDTPSIGSLSKDGFAVFCFLTGQRSDSTGATLEQALQWKDWELANHLRTVPWMFPLTTPSSLDPAAPVPTRHDGAVLGAQAPVREGLLAALALMLRFYGFEWRDGEVKPSEDWRTGFATWAPTPTHHDLLISRMLGALSLMGLRAEARQVLKAFETAALHYRGPDAHDPLRHWRLAVFGA